MGDEERARLAQDVLDNPVLQLAVADLKQDLMTTWSKSDAFDTKGREQAFLYHRALDTIMSRLQGYVSNLKLQNYNKARFEDELM